MNLGLPCLMVALSKFVAPYIFLKIVVKRSHRVVTGQPDLPVVPIMLLPIMTNLSDNAHWASCNMSGDIHVFKRSLRVHKRQKR